MAAPVVNINTAGAFGLSNLDLANAVTGWAGFRHTGGGTPSPQLEQDIFLQGTAAVSIKVTSAGLRDEGVWFDNTTGIDMTTTGRHFYIWAACTTVNALNTRANGGIYIICASDAAGANWSKWFVGGSDVSPLGFIRFVMDLNKTPSETAATPCTISSVRWFGIGVKSNGMTAKSENVVVDRIDYGDGLQIEAGDTTDPANWEALFSADDNINNKYGIIEKRSGIYFIKGGLTIGDPAGTVTTLWLDDGGSAVRFENPLYYNGVADVSTIDEANLYKIELVGNGTGTTDIDFGSVIGTGDDRQGIGGGIISSDGPPFAIDGETDIADLDSVNFYGMTFAGGGVLQFSGSTKTDIIGCTFVDCDEIQPNDAEFLNNVVVSPMPDRGLEMLSTHNIKQVSFVAGSTADQAADRAWQVAAGTPTFVEQTSGFNDATAGNCTPFPASEAVNDYFAIGFRSKFAGLNIDTGTARSGGTLVWEYYNGSSWSSLTVTDGTNTLSTTGPQDVTFDPPADWAALSLNDETPLFYVRLRVTATMTTNPIIDQGFITDTVEHHLHIPVAGTYTADALNFFGHSPIGSPKWHGENSSSATNVTTYADSNRDGTQALGNGTTIGFGQSFAATAGKLGKAVFTLSKTLSPTGNIVARLYAHTGTFGTNGTPTGAALAESDPVDAAGLSGTLTETEFKFRDEFTLVAATNYFLVLEYSGGDASNFVNVGQDSSGPTHPGNSATLVGSVWSSGSPDVAAFIVDRDGIVIINAQNGADPNEDEFENTATVPGVVAVNNTVDLKVTITNQEADVLQGINVRYEESDGTKIADGSTNASGVFNFQIDVSDLPLTDAVIIARRKDFEDFETTLDIPVSGFDIPISLQPDLDVNLP